MRQAVLDLGSQTFHVSVFEATAGRLVALERAREFVRLGDGRDLLDPRVLNAAGGLIARARGVPLTVVATSAVREAAEREAFRHALRRAHGVFVEVLSGEEEARLSYIGARSALEEPAGRVAVIDFGGGSTEVAVGDDGGSFLQKSLPLGALTLRHQLVPADGYVSERTATAVAALVRLLAEQALQAVQAAAPQRVVLASGTARAVRHLAHDLEERPQGDPVLTRAGLRRLSAILAKFRPTDLPSLGVEEARTDTIAVGAVTLDVLLDLLGASEAWVSERGLREGVALRELARRAEADARRSAAPAGGSARP